MTQFQRSIKAGMFFKFPGLSAVSFSDRRAPAGVRQYCRVTFDGQEGGYDRLGTIRTFLRSMLGTEVYLTSGGPSGGTFRLNPD